MEVAAFEKQLASSFSSKARRLATCSGSPESDQRIHPVVKKIQDQVIRIVPNVVSGQVLF